MAGLAVERTENLKSTSFNEGRVINASVTESTARWVSSLSTRHLYHNSEVILHTIAGSTYETLTACFRVHNAGVRCFSMCDIASVISGPSTASDSESVVTSWSMVGS